MIGFLAGAGAFIRGVPNRYVLLIVVGGYLLGMVLVVLAIKALQQIPRRIDADGSEDAFSIRRMDELLGESTRIRTELDRIPLGSQATDDHVFDIRCWAREAARVMAPYSDAVSEIGALPLGRQRYVPDELRGYLHRASQYVIKYKTLLSEGLQSKRR